MLGTIRKFSSSILAKIFLFIVAIPFVFWGMGDLFRGGNQNVIVKIANEKISTEDFINYIKYNTPSNDVINKKLIENLFAKFVGEKLMNMEIENLDIILSNSSLSKIIKNEKIFKRNDNFSRIEYEKFLVSKSIDPVTFEKNLLEQIKKEQLFDFIGGGISPSKFLVNLDFDRINQKRFVKIIDLNLAYKDDINFSDEQIKALVDRGAVIGGVLDAWMLVSGWRRGETTPESSGVKLEHLLDHMDHICQLTGNANHIGIGTDLDGGYGLEQSPGDMDTIADLQHLPEMLEARGYSSLDVTGVMHGNFIRFLNNAWS